MLIFFAAVERKLLAQAGLEKAEWGSTSTVPNKL